MAISHAIDVHEESPIRSLSGGAGIFADRHRGRTVRDLFTGALAARMMSMVVLVVGVAPIIAPLIGSLLLHLAGWRAIFILLAAFGTLCAIVARILLPETRAVEQRTSSGVRGTLRLYGRLLISRNFIPYAGALALAQGAFFAASGSRPSSSPFAELSRSTILRSISRKRCRALAAIRSALNRATRRGQAPRLIRISPMPFDPLSLFGTLI